MSVLQRKEDGTFVVPVLGEKPREVTLRVPSVGEQGSFYDLIDKADEDLKAVIDVQERERLRLDPVESPYGKAFVEIVQRLGGEEVLLADLPSWATSPRTLRELREAWGDPFGGNKSSDLLEMLGRIKQETEGLREAQETAATNGQPNRETRRAAAKKADDKKASD